jgi:hypothetical protein
MAIVIACAVVASTAMPSRSDDSTQAPAPDHSAACNWIKDKASGTAGGKTIRGLAVSSDGLYGWAVGDTCLRLSNGEWNIDDAACKVAGGVGLAAVALEPGGRKRGWAVGGCGIVLRLESDGWTRDDAASSTSKNANGDPQALNGLVLDVLHQGEGWAVGDVGVVLRLANGKWKRDDLASALSGHADLQAVALEPKSPDCGWAMGQGVVLRLSKGAWVKDQDATKILTEKLVWVLGIALDDQANGWAVGWKGVVVRLERGRWRIDEIASKASGGLWLSSVVPRLDAARGDLAVGERGVILKMGEVQWVKDESASSASGGKNLFGLAVNSRGCWAVGENSAILHCGE